MKEIIKLSSRNTYLTLEFSIIYLNMINEEFPIFFESYVGNNREQKSNSMRSRKEQ